MDFNVNESIYAIGNKNQAELIEQQKQVDVDMQKLYEKSPELAQEKATEIGKVIAQDAFNSAKSILTELKAFKESGSTEMFVPSVLTEHIMPNYTVVRVMDEVSTEASYATLEKELENAKTVLADELAVGCNGRKCVAKCERLETKRRKIESREKSFFSCLKALTL